MLVHFMNMLTFLAKLDTEMKLQKVRVTNFKSILDSTDVNIQSKTCLVGKNQSGKTAFLMALAGFKPYDANLNYDLKRDYPRPNLHKNLAHYNEQDQTVITSTWDLEDSDTYVLKEEFGENFVCPTQLVLKKHITAMSFMEKFKLINGCF